MVKLVLSSGLCIKLFLKTSRYEAMDDGLRILVLGGEESPEDLIEYELSKSNLRFIALRVTSREAFLQALQESSPNLILVTTGHPEIGGLTALALAQEFCPGTPCFLINPPGRQKRAVGDQEDQSDEAGHSLPNVHLENTISSFFTVTSNPVAWDKPEAPLKNPAALQPLLQIAGVVIAFLSPDGRILEFNRGAERFTGWRRHEALGKNGLELFFPETDRMSALVHLQRVMSGKSTESIDLTLQGRNGSAVGYRWYCNLVSDNIGQPAGIMLVGQPLSESKPWESQPRARLARCCPAPAVSQGRGLLTHRTGTC
jgi:PAS domain S-box-containing protein